MSVQHDPIEGALATYHLIPSHLRRIDYAEGFMADLFSAHGYSTCVGFIEHVAAGDESWADVNLLSSALVIHLAKIERYDEARQCAEAFCSDNDDTVQVLTEIVAAYILVVENAPSDERRMEFRDLVRTTIPRLDTESQILARINLALALCRDDQEQPDTSDVDEAIQLTQHAAANNDHETAALGFLSLSDVIRDAEPFNAAIHCMNRLTEQDAIRYIQDSLVEKLTQNPIEFATEVVDQLIDRQLQNRARAALITQQQRHMVS